MSQALTFPDNSYDRQRRDPPRKRLRPADVITRAAVCELMQRRGASSRPPELSGGDVVDRTYQGCSATRWYLARAAVNPAMTTVATWAAELVQTSIIDFLNDMQRESAFAALTTRPGVLVVTNNAPVKVPGRASPWGPVGGWVLEGGPKPVGAIGLTSITLTPRKLSAISVFTEETMDYSTPAIEQLVEQALRHDLGALLDQSLLDNVAVSTARPSGLLNGVTPITASTATPTSEAMAKDLGALAGAVSVGHPDARVTYLANSAQAARMTASGYDAIATNFLVPGTVVAVDSAALAMTVSNPAFLVSGNASLHMESAPLALGTGTQGAGVLAVPLSSMFQIDALALRATLPAAWMVRRAGAVASVVSVSW